LVNLAMKQMPMRNILICCCLCCGAPLSAQKMPVAGDPGRLLQIIDLQAVRPEARGHAPAPAAFAGVDAFVRGFLDPPRGSDDDVRLLGSHQLVVLGSAQQAAFVENLVAKAVQHRNEAVTVDVRLLAMGPGLFERKVRPLLEKTEAEAADGPIKAVLGGVALQTLRLAFVDPACQHLQAMVVCVRLLERANLRLGNEVRYTADFEPDVRDASKPAMPVTRSLFDGQTVDVMATILGKDQLAVQCEVTQSEVQTPLPEAKVSLGTGDPVTIQVPRVRTTHFEQRAVQPAGSSLVVASRRQSGDWLVAVITAAVSGGPRSEGETNK
jgi:hypothetical protein